MTDERITVDVAACPLCGGAHSYEVEVRFTSTLKMPRPGVCLSPQPVRLRETFRCPEQKEPFDHTFEIRLPAGSAVAGVEVVG